MRLFQTMETSASGLTAQRLRMDIIADNLANVNTTRTTSGDPYRRKMPIFAAREPEKFAGILARTIGKENVGQGVRVVGITEDPEPFKLVYNPGHPDADADGYVRMPNVNVVTEMVDMIAATRAYEANVTALNATKEIFMKSLEIGR